MNYSVPGIAVSIFFLSSLFAVFCFASWVSSFGAIPRSDGTTENGAFKDPQQFWMMGGVLLTGIGIIFGMASDVLMTEQRSTGIYILAIIVLSAVLTVIFKKTGRMRSP